MNFASLTKNDDDDGRDRRFGPCTKSRTHWLTM